MNTVDPSHNADSLARRSDVEWVEVDEEAVLYDPAAHMLHRLNESATAVWAACDGRSSSEMIIRAIEDVYAAEGCAIAGDVPAVIKRFRRLGLLRRAEAEPAG
jgi:Coenzyme PQQ synthesis protein D (PqqD)